MGSGMPFSEAEKEFIRSHMDAMYPGMIAQKLAELYPGDNAGYRSWRSVRRFIYRERHDTDTPISISVPRKLLQEAKSAGITMEQITTIARSAIIKTVRT